MPKYKTLVIDSVGELARLYFSKDMGKSASSMDQIRAVNNYPGSTERLNMTFRRFIDLRKKGVNVVVLGHEQIERLYAKGGMIAGKGQPPPEPIAIRGIPDLPGNTAPEELMRKCDIILRMRMLNQKPVWICKPEALAQGIGDAQWAVGGRCDPLLVGDGYWPSDYAKIDEIAKAKVPNWAPPYVWLIYGRPKIGKTRAIESFPKPIKLIDLDSGSIVLGTKEQCAARGIDIIDDINPEESKDYDKFIAELESTFK